MLAEFSNNIFKINKTSLNEVHKQFCNYASEENRDFSMPDFSTSSLQMPGEFRCFVICSELDKRMDNTLVENSLKTETPRKNMNHDA